MKPQPAIKSYFFGKGWADLWRMLKDFWRRNMVSARQFSRDARIYWQDPGWAKISSLPLAFASVSVFIFGTAWTFVLSVLHVTILLVFFLLIYLSYTSLWLLERFYMILRGIFTVCPHCHRRSLFPHYQCPQCHVIHTRLTPGKYGVVGRTCLCGQNLPTTFFQRRTRLAEYARCPYPDCSGLLGTREAIPICLPLVGGPSVGKTCYLFAATDALVQDMAAGLDWELSILGAYSSSLYQRIENQFHKGIRPDKTMARTPPAFNMFIRNPDWSMEKLLYLYDAAGEAFGSVDTLISHRFYGFLHGFIFLIDPFSIPELVERYAGEIKQQGQNLRPGSMDMQDTYRAMLMNLEKNHGFSRRAVIDKPIAVVLTKVDAFDLEDRVGYRAAQGLIASEAGVETIGEAIDHLCRAFLDDLGLEEFLTKLDMKFKTIRFFSVSALGRTPDESGTPFEPMRVLDPLLWLLSQVDREIGNDLSKKADQWE
jgi:hypothetical protein